MNAYTVGPGEGEATWFGPNHMTLKATAETTGGAYGIVESWVRAGSSPPLHIHHREDEAFWILEGEVTFRCGDETFSAGPGSFTFLPRDVPHTFVVEGDAHVHLLTLLSPGGGERFFVDGGRPAEHEGLPPAPSGPPDIAGLNRVAQEYGSEIVGPRMQPRSRSASAAG